MSKYSSFSQFSDKLNEEAGSQPEFFGRIFQSRDIAHLNHLGTKSFAAHKALNEYYDGIVDILDTLIEAYQGKYGIITIEIPGSKTNQIDSIEFFNELGSYVKTQKDVNFKDSELLNIVDEITSLIDTTLYKLKELK